ncbi:hypothetical protein ACFMPD_05905 [Sedimentitalea sp. HM32M-2]|uniref:hypothetical protein n=1 Tax=Sedimentitalea sp. HM32M-2 TaxID=3351566 RepID=UPI00362E86BA
MKTMTLTLTQSLILALGLAGCTTPVWTDQRVQKQVQVLGRTWTVTPDAKKPDAYIASRDNNNLNPFGKPVARRTPQAVRALELATGCKVVPGTLSQNVSAEFRADMACTR